MNRLRYYSEVISLQLIREKCNNCGMCVKVCPHEIFEMIDKKVHIVGRDFCMECGAVKRTARKERSFSMLVMDADVQRGSFKAH